MAKKAKGRAKGSGGGKAGDAGRDALGRRLRAERRRINALKARLEPLDEWKRHRVAARIPGMAKKIREKLGLSLNGAAELTELTVPGIVKFENGKGGGRNHTLGLLCRGYCMKVSSFMRRIEREVERGVPP